MILTTKLKKSYIYKFASEFKSTSQTLLPVLQKKKKLFMKLEPALFKTGISKLYELRY